MIEWTSFQLTDDPFWRDHPYGIAFVSHTAVGEQWSFTHPSLTRENEMTLLIPDRNRDNLVDMVWCLPIQRDKWNKWWKLSTQFKCKTETGMRYMNRMEGKKIHTVILLPTGEQSDDDASTAAAWFRFVKQFTGKIYVARCTDDPPRTFAQTITDVAGADSRMLMEVDDDNPTEI